MKQTWKQRAGAAALTLTLLAGLLPAAPARAAGAADLSAEQAGAYRDVYASVLLDGLEQRCASYNLPKVKNQWTAAEQKDLERLLHGASKPYPSLTYDCMDTASYGGTLFYASDFVKPLEAQDDFSVRVYSLEHLQTWLRENVGIELGLSNQTNQVYSLGWNADWKMTVQNGRATLAHPEFGVGIPDWRIYLREIYDLGNQTYLVYFGKEEFHDVSTGDEEYIVPNTAIVRKVGGKLSLLRFDGTDTVIPGTEADLRKYSGAAPAALAYASQSDIYVDGKKISFDAYALRDAAGNATNYLKLRDVAWALNGSAAQFNVGWEKGTITLTTGAAYTSANGSEMKRPFSGDQLYQVSTNHILVDGRAMQISAILLTAADGSGHTYVKLRDLGTALGFSVDWDAATGTVQIGTNEP